jgi:hypothetical protein
LEILVFGGDYFSKIITNQRHPYDTSEKSRGYPEYVRLIGTEAPLLETLEIHSHFLEEDSKG